MFGFIQNWQSIKKQNQYGFGTGAKPQELDYRDHVFASGSGVVKWATGYDLNQVLTDAWGKPFKLKPNNQNGSSSCVGQGWAKYGSVKNYIERGEWNDISAKDIYSEIALSGGGAYGRDGGMLLVNRGASIEQRVPSYDNGQPPEEAFMRKKTKEDVPGVNLRRVVKLAEIRSVNTFNIEAAAQAISLNHGMVFAVKGTNNGSWLSVLPKVGQWDWSHYLFAVAYKLINSVKHVGVINSWGNACGDGGYQWLSEEWFVKNMVYDGWTATDELNKLAREADYEKFNAVMWTTPLPEPDHIPYTDINWNFVQKTVGIFDITPGMHYDYEMAKKLRKQYKI